MTPGVHDVLSLISVFLLEKKTSLGTEHGDVVSIIES